jgi:hypothetical protein
MDSTSESNHTFRNVSMLWWIAAFAICLTYALTHSFSSMATYDDESYVMMTIKTFLEGDRLYAQTYTQYGPAYYMLQTPIHGWLGLPITHDIVRLKTVFCWLLMGGLAGLIVARVTGKSLAALTAMLMTVLHLENLGLEPAHPQEVVALLSLVCLLAMNSYKWHLLFLAGVCAAFAGMAKLNVGAVGLFAAGFSGVSSSRTSKLWASLGSIIAVGLSAGVFWEIAKKSVSRDEYVNLAWPGLIVVAAIFLVATAIQESSRLNEKIRSRNEDQRFFFSPFVAVVIGGIAGSGFVVAWAMNNGNSFQEILYGVVLQHSFMSESFYHPMQFVTGGIPFALVAVCLLAARIVLRFSNRDADSIDRYLGFLPPMALAISILLIGMDCWKPLVHGLNARGAARFLATAGPVLMPIVLLKGATQFRLSLAMCGCLSPLLAFPVPGTQVALGTLPIVIGLIVCSFDTCEQQQSVLPIEFCRKCWVGLTTILVVSTAVFFTHWIKNTPLNQPGCRWVRLDPSRAKAEKAIASSINKINSPWLAFDTQNHNRFFFWTGKKPLTSISPTFWPLMLTETQQQKIVAAAEKVDSICVIKLPNEQVQLSEHAPGIEKSLFRRWNQVDDVSGWKIGKTTR